MVFTGKLTEGLIMNLFVKTKNGIDDEAAEIGTYRLYLAASKTPNVTSEINRAGALANCRQNAAANPGVNVRCSWATTIFSNGNSGSPTKPSTEKGTYLGFSNGKQFIETKDITRAHALANCKLNAAANPKDKFLCRWRVEFLCTAAAAAAQ